MTKHEELKHYQNASADEKLAALAIEMARPIAVIKGFASITIEALRSQDILCRDELSDWMSKVLEAGDDLAELREILALSPNEKN